MPSLISSGTITVMKSFGPRSIVVRYVCIAPSRSPPRQVSGSRSTPPPANARHRSWSSGGTASPATGYTRVDVGRAEGAQVPERLRGRRVQVAHQQHHVVRAERHPA